MSEHTVLLPHSAYHNPQIHLSSDDKKEKVMFEKLMLLKEKDESWPLFMIQQLGRIVQSFCIVSTFLFVEKKCLM